MRTLIIFGHTFFKDSKVNKKLLDSAKELKDVRVHNLSLLYPSGNIDVARELELVREADKIVFQFPLFWFSVPAILKEWQDVVLSAVLHEKSSSILQGKKFQIITTLGGTENTYDGHHGATLRELLLPIVHSFRYCGCEVVDFLAFFSANEDNIDLDVYQKQLMC